MFGDGNLSERVIAAAIRVHQVLGPGYGENVYKRALRVQLSIDGIKYEVEKEVFIYYEGVKVGRHVLDLLVDGRIVVEAKTVESIGKAQYAQVRSYLKATDLSLGLLINFSGERADFRRIQNHRQ